MSFGDAFCHECGASIAGAAHAAQAAAEAAAAARGKEQASSAVPKFRRGLLAKLAKRKAVPNMEQLMPPTFVRRAERLFAGTEYKHSSYFTDMRYTPVAVDEPHDFEDAGYNLLCAARPEMVTDDGGNKIRLLVCITMHQEGEAALNATLRAVCENIKSFQNVWDDRSLTWENVAVCVVADGREHVNQDTLDYLSELGVFDKDLLFHGTVSSGSGDLSRPASERFDLSTGSFRTGSAHARTVTPTGSVNFGAPGSPLLGALGLKQAGSRSNSLLARPPSIESVDTLPPLTLDTAAANNENSRRQHRSTASDEGDTDTFRMRLERVEQRRQSDPEGSKIEEFFAQENRRREAERELNRKAGADGKRVRVSVHLFEFTTQMREDPSFEQCFPPLQLSFALKEKWTGKLDSHRWFFHAFAQVVQPKYCLLLHAGSVPKPRAICKLYFTLENKADLGGCCGEIVSYKPSVFDPVMASQHFDNMIHNMLDISVQSVFGYISLPSAFTVYRYEAIEGQPLEDYFSVVHCNNLLQQQKESGDTTGNSIGIWDVTAFASEGRILCYSIVMSQGSHWKLQYLKSAKATIAMPSTIHSILSHRSHHVTGHFFVSLYAILQYSFYVTRTRHSILQRMAITALLAYQATELFFVFFQPVLMLLYTYFVYSLTFADVNAHDGTVMIGGMRGESLGVEYAQGSFSLFLGVYVIVCVLQLVAALGNDPSYLHRLYTSVALGLSFLWLMVLALRIADTKSYGSWDASSQGAQYEFFTISSLLDFVGTPWYPIAIISCWMLPAVLYGRFNECAPYVLQYIIMAPVYVNMVPIYAFSNLHLMSKRQVCIDVLPSVCATFRLCYLPPRFL
jgi:cellulose synthase/poly-beta-1,6-N-acetylglucosamine synthase-like glycosyltransferase